MAEKGFSCQCIRCREVALNDPDALDRGEPLRYRELRYRASSGLEVFGSYEYERSRLIAGFFRMRLPSARAHRGEMQSASVVRELRVYGPAVGVGRRNLKAWQHRGLGAVLMRRAEVLAREDLGASKMLVISAVGTRHYYRKLGYQREGPYMAKALK